MSIQIRVPPRWKTVLLADLCHKITDGTHHSPSETDQTPSGEFAYVTAKNIKEWGIDLTRITYLPERIHKPIFDRCNPEQGDVLYIKDGATTGIATVNQLDEPFSLLSSVALLKPKREVLEPRFLKWFLNSPNGYSLMTSQMTGTAIKRLTLTKIKEAWAPVAPLPEQRRIVAKIEELFSDLDAGVAALLRVRANLKRYRAAVLKAAVEGHLTEEWRTRNPATEPAAKLLERILADRRAKWEQDQLRKFKEAGKTPPKGWKEKYGEPTPESSVEIGALPGGWCAAQIGTIADTSTGGTPSRARPDFFGGSIRRVKSGELGDSVVSHTEETISEAGLDNSSAKVFPIGTLCIALYGATVGKVGVLGIPAATNQAVCAMFLPSGINTRFAFYYLISIRAQLVALGKGGAQPNISNGIVRATEFPLPPLAEQSEVVAEVDRRLSVADAAEVQVAHALQRAARLRQSILKRAFEGRLADQDLADGLVAMRSPGGVLANGSKGAAPADRKFTVGRRSLGPGNLAAPG